MKPLIVESKQRILLETNSQVFQEVKKNISPFLELTKALKFFHVYSLTHVSLWNGFVLGIDHRAMERILKNYSKYPLPKEVVNFITDNFNHFNTIKLVTYNDKYDWIKSERRVKLPAIIKKLESEIKNSISQEGDKLLLLSEARGIFKSNMIHLGYPVNDVTEFLDGEPLEVRLLEKKVSLRGYQEEARDAFLSDSKYGKGAVGLVVLPCGAGKTIVGISVIAALKMTTLIITPNVIALRQWRKELLHKTDISADDIAEYSGVVKQIRKVTLTTYQILTHRGGEEDQFHHLFLFQKKNWGLIIYDEIHMLPAKVFRYVSSVQSKRRLGLTATLVREDGNEKQVFSLIGPKKYDVSWKDLENINFLAKVNCFEVKVKMPPSLMEVYFSTASEKKRYLLASTNPHKLKLVDEILHQFKGYQIIIIGQYLQQLEEFQARLQVPLITGRTNYLERQKVYEDFNNEKINLMIVSKIANFAIDLPNAEVAIQVSGTFGSRQEEAQRLGRIIRPKKKRNNQAYFISLVTKYSKEEFLAQNRKGFLASQGYSYQVRSEENLAINH